jgi:hypothetical protein
MFSLHVHAIKISQTSNYKSVHLSIQWAIMSFYYVLGTVIYSGNAMLTKKQLVFK